MPQTDNRIEIGPEQVQIDAGTVARAFQITPQQLRHKLHDGTLTSRFEQGADSDAGHVRLTFYSDKRRVRIVADSLGAIRSCEISEYGPRRAGATDSSDRARLDALLDAALEATFPASDPIAITPTTARGRTRDGMSLG